MVTLTVKQTAQAPLRVSSLGIFAGTCKNTWWYSIGWTGTPEKRKRRILAAGYFSSFLRSQSHLGLWQRRNNRWSLFAKRIEKAYSIRKAYLGSPEQMLLYHQWRNDLAGLIVDKYADYLVVQFHTAASSHGKKKSLRPGKNHTPERYLWTLRCGCEKVRSSQ